MSNDIAPLNELIRPSSLREYIGQEHLTNPDDGAIVNFIRLGYLPSMLLYGPPGVGKTTLAGVLAREARYVLLELSATEATVATLRQLLGEIRAENRKRARNGEHGLRVCVFIDEIHRFTKVQQDFLLPFVEEGLFVFIGATTVNPASRIRPAIRSRCQLFELHELTDSEVDNVLRRAVLRENIRRKTRYGLQFMSLSPEAARHLTRECKGDARTAVNVVEMLSMSIASDAYDGTFLPVPVTVAQIDVLIKDMHRKKSGLAHARNAGCFVRLLDMLYKSQPAKCTRQPADDSAGKRTFQEQMEHSDDEYQSPEPLEHPKSPVCCEADVEVSLHDLSETMTKTDFLKTRAIMMLLQLLSSGESPYYILKQLVFFAGVYVDDKEILRRTVSAAKALAVCDTLTVLSGVIEQLIESPKFDFSETQDPYSVQKRALSFLERKKATLTHEKPTFLVESNDSLAEYLLSDTMVDYPEEAVPFPVTLPENLGHLYTVGDATNANHTSTCFEKRTPAGLAPQNSSRHTLDLP